jgi:transcriptional regulator with XRE-family HTH domain
MNNSSKARKHYSPKLQELFNEVSPVEMEQTKIKMQLAARIEDLVKSKGWNKSKFAKVVDKNPSEITKWFSGNQNFTVDVLTEIAFVLGVETSFLFEKRQPQVFYRKTIEVNSPVFQHDCLFSRSIEGNMGFPQNLTSGRSQYNSVLLTNLFHG